MKKTLPLLYAALLIASPAQATDLLSIYRDAMTYDAQFAAARAERDAGLEKLPQSKAGLRPQINLAMDTQWNDLSSKLRTSPMLTMGPDFGQFMPDHSSTRYNTHGWTVSLAQPLFRWQNWSTYKQGELAAAAAEVQYSTAKQELIERITQAYFDVLLAQEDLATAQAQQAAIAEQLEAAKRNFEVGTTTITDTHEARARHDLVNASLIASQSNLQMRRQALRMLTGKEVEELQRLRSGIQISAPQPANADQWAESAERDNFGVLLAKSQFEIAERELEKQRVGHYPTVDLVASHSRQSSGTNTFMPALGGSDNDVSLIGLQLKVPLYSGGLVSSKSREAVALREKSRAQLDNARRGAALQARQAYLGVTSGLAQVKALEQSVLSSQSALDSNKLGYEVGVRVNIDVLNAQQQLYATRRDLAKARIETLMSQMRLKAATGSLSEQDVVAINALLEN